MLARIFHRPKFGKPKLTFMVSRDSHVWNTFSQFIHPVLPQIPVGLVDRANVTTPRTTLVGNFTSRQRLEVRLWFVTGRQKGVGSIGAPASGTASIGS